MPRIARLIPLSRHAKTAGAQRLTRKRHVRSVQLFRGQEIKQLDIRNIKFTEILGYPAADEILREYAEECSIPEIGPTNPQAHLYEAMQASGLLQTFGAYDGVDLIGFATILMYVLPHYGQKIATVESLFVKKAHRAGVGRALMQAIELHAKSAGCKAILYSARTASRLEKLLSALSCYRNTNSIFLRKL